MAKALGKNGKSYKIRVLLDTASSTNLITSSLINTGKLHTDVLDPNHKVEMTTLNSSKIYDSQVCIIKLLMPNNTTKEVKTYVVPKIARLPYTDINIPKEVQHLCNDTFPRAEQNIDLLLGVKQSLSLLKGSIMNITEDTFLVQTPWGYIVVGNNIACTPYKTFVTQTELLNKNIEKNVAP